MNDRQRQRAENAALKAHIKAAERAERREAADTQWQVKVWRSGYDDAPYDESFTFRTFAQARESYNAHVAKGQRGELQAVEMVRRDATLASELLAAWVA